MSNSEKKKVLVTGGGGFLGKAIIRKLVEQGQPVWNFSRHSYPDLEALGVQQIQGDLSDKSAVENALSGMDTVYHVAAKPGVWGTYDEYYKPNVLGTRNVIHACKKNNIKNLIYTSSPSVIFTGKDMEGVDESIPYPEKTHTHYTHTKTIAEKEVREAAKQGLNTIILRPHLIWGPGDPHLVPRVIQRSRKLVRVGSRNSLVDTIYIDNAADAHILAAKKLEENPSLSGKIYFISQDDPIPIWDMINGILNAAGLSPITRTLPLRVVWTIGAILEFFYTVFRIPGEPKMTRFVANELGTSHWFDIRAAKKDLGYSPQISTEEGFRRLKEWLVQNPILVE